MKFFLLNPLLRPLLRLTLQYRHHTHFIHSQATPHHTHHIVSSLKPHLHTPHLHHCHCHTDTSHHTLLHLLLLPLLPLLILLSSTFCYPLSHKRDRLKHMLSSFYIGHASHSFSVFLLSTPQPPSSRLDDCLWIFQRYPCSAFPALPHINTVTLSQHSYTFTYFS